MKTRKLFAISRNILLTLITSVILFSFNSCARKTTFLTSTVVPAARGSVKVRKDKNNNYIIKIQLSYLAESKRLQPPKNFYIVWMITDNNAPKNIGQIKTTNNLKVSFETVSALRPTKIFITAEDDATTQYPFSEVVLTTNNF